MLVLEDPDEGEHLKVIFIFGAFKVDDLGSLISLVCFEFEEMNLTDFKLLILEKVSE